MRILATNPDTIGDLILREPLYRALREAGHELTLITQPLVEPLVSSVAPGATTYTLDLNPYDPDLRPEDGALDDISALAVALEPEMLLVAPYQWSPIDARLSRDLAGARRVAFAGIPYFHPDLARPADWGVEADTFVPVDEDTPELTKNKKLARAVLGKGVKLDDPAIEADESQLDAADAVLAGFALDPGAYWIGCIGHPPHAAVRNWPLDRWADLLAGWAERHHRRFLLIGNGDERETTRKVIKALGTSNDIAYEWYGDIPEDLDTLIGLCARSAGYVGRDTGPMHLAAALRRPVLAVFGAGTWPRFVPAVDPSIAITVGVPTSGCGWDAKVDSAYAIDEVPLDMVAKGADDLEAGKLKRRTKRLAPASEALLRRIAGESVQRVRGYRIQATTERLKTLERERHMQDISAVLDRTVKQASDAANAARAESQRLQGEVQQLRATITALQDKLAKSEASRQAAELTGARAEEAVASLRDRHEEARRRAERLEQQAERRAEELIQLRLENAKLKELSQTQPRLRQEHAALQEQVERLRAERDAMASRLKVVEAHTRHLEEEETGAASKLGGVQQTLEQTRSRIGQIQGELDDTLRKLDRSESEQKTLSALSRQQAKELIVLRKRLDELRASRWRKLGQRIGVAMVLPWEHESSNGKQM